MSMKILVPLGRQYRYDSRDMAAYLRKVNNNIETGTGILIFRAIPNMFWCLLAVSQGFLPLSHRAYSENSETMSNCVKFSDFHEK